MDTSLFQTPEEVESQLKQVDEFILSLATLRGQLERKKVTAKDVIQSKIRELHQLVDKWEQRYLDTANETLDEKIEALKQQEDKFVSLTAWVRDHQAELAKMTAEAPDENGKEPLVPPTEDQFEELTKMNSPSLNNEDDDQPETELAKKHVKAWNNLSFPLKPSGASYEEAKNDIRTEFGILLEESRKSLKRSLLFVGGIVRGYLRRGHKRDEWVDMMRRIEARTEIAPAPSDSSMDLAVTTTASSTVTEIPLYLDKGDKAVWDVVSAIYLNRTNPTAMIQITRRLHILFSMYPVQIEFYVIQLVNMLLCYKDPSLSQFIMQACKERNQFSIYVYFAIASLSQVGPMKWQRRCIKLLKEVIDAVPASTEPPNEKVLILLAGTFKAYPSEPKTIAKPSGIEMLDQKQGIRAESSHTTTPPISLSAPKNDQHLHIAFSPPPNKIVDVHGTTHFPDIKDPLGNSLLTNSSSSVDQPPKVDKTLEIPKGKEYFFGQIKFLRKLIDVSRKLGEIYGQKDKYKEALDKELDALEPFIEAGVAYLPSSTSSLQKVLRIVKEESSPIQTFGRVLYKMVAEIVELPQHYTSRVIKQYIKLTDDFATVSRQPMSPLKEEAQTPTLPSEVATTGNYFGEPWRDTRKRIKATSNYGSLPDWNCSSFIIKHGDLVLQEQFVMQLIHQIHRIWQMEGLPLTLTCYNIVGLSYQSGLIEVVPNSLSFDKLRKLTNQNGLLEFFRTQWPNSDDYKKARSHFVQSMAAYSILCYILQIKDRHNGNIMLESDGNLFHIDFGYLLSRTVKFEKAPFKLTEELIEVMGGDQSKWFKEYCQLCVKGYNAVRKQHEKIAILIDMTTSEGGAIPCLEKDSIGKNLIKRFHLEWDDGQCEEFILNLICEARDNWRTQIYDSYQRLLNDIH